MVPKEYALKQASAVRNERVGSESQGGDKAGTAGQAPFDRLDHLEDNEGESAEDQEALAVQKKRKSKGIKGNCFNCGKQGLRAADCWPKGGGQDAGAMGQHKSGYGKGCPAEA